MKKALKSKLSASKKLVRRVLSKSSHASHEPAPGYQEAPSMTEEVLLANEIEALKDQTANLKAAINALHEETEKKEMAIAKLAREKEKLNLELLKQKRCNHTLAQQLEDERIFYYREKEIYCQEMNECKKIKRMMSHCSITGEERTLAEYKSEILKMKQTLNQTLEANYNLSIKFLRMKNTKTCLRTQLKTMKLEHEKLEHDYKSKIENLSAELNDLINEKLPTPMSPSNKKHLQLVKQNSCLVYENLCLQLEVDNLNLKFEKLKLERTKSETNERLKYIHHTKSERPEEIKHHRRTVNKDPRRVQIIQDEAPEKLERDPKPSCSGNRSSKAEKIVKIFERKELPGVPDIKIINEKETRTKVNKQKHQSQFNVRKESDDNNKPTSKHPEKNDENPDDIPDHQIEIDEKSREKFLNIKSSKLRLFQVSDMLSVTCSSEEVNLTPILVRSRSSPDILSGTLFHKPSVK